MADPQFEQFRAAFEKLPQYIKAPQHCYRLTHDINIDSSSSEASPEEESPSFKNEESLWTQVQIFGEEKININNNNNNNNNSSSPIKKPPPPVEKSSPQNGERKRRKLPEIPKKKATGSCVVFTTRAPSLADELREAELKGSSHSHLPIGVHLDLRNAQHTDIRHLGQWNYALPEEDSSPEEKGINADFDSGNSTAHSPDGAKCFSPVVNGFSSPSSPGSSSGVSGSTLELLEATHRGLHKFIPRHHDEIDVEIGDPVYIQKEADDLWCEGVNLRTGKCGIFPSAYVTDVNYEDFDPDGVQAKKERFLLKFLGSIEVTQHKGNIVLCQAVRKIVGMQEHLMYPPHPCILEVSDQGLRMVDKSRPQANDVPCHDYFFSLKNVTFCAYHPRDHRYFGFITKHPIQDRLACHVFSGTESTRPVAEAIGRAFHRFYHKFIETAFPIEDIYLE